MKKVFTLFVSVLLTATLGAQSPEKMSYQAVIRNSDNALVTNTQIGMEINILQGSLTGTIVYTETQTPTTNTNGLVSIEIGGGTVVSGNFSTIDWSSGQYYVETKIATSAPLTSYTITGTSQLISVPYALYAKSSGTTGDKGPRGDKGLTGDKGATGDKGEAGDPAVLFDNTQALTNKTWSSAKIKDELDLKASSTALTTGLNGKVDKVTGKGLSTEDYTTAEKTKVSNLSGTNTGDQDLSALASTTALATGLNGKVDTVTGKGLTTNDYTTDEKTKLSGIANGAEVNVQADWNQTTNTADDYIKNKPTIPATVDGSETKVTAGTNVTITGSGTTANPYVVNATGDTTLNIGDSYQGGIIFWLDATGQHGLIVATEDHSTDVEWYNGTFRYTGSKGNGFYTGAMNTAMIVATQMADNQTGNFAAKVCADYSVTVGGVTYGDWYLPSITELNLLYQQKTAVGYIGHTFIIYWSSTEVNNLLAWRMYFGDGGHSMFSKSYPFSVRSIRAF